MSVFQLISTINRPSAANIPRTRGTRPSCWYVTAPAFAGPEQWPNGSGARAGDRWVSLVYDAFLERSTLYAWRLGD